MQNQVSIFIFCDALGYDAVNRHRFMEQEFPFRRCIRTQLGYSSACVPTILSGEPPTVHNHFSFFYHDRSGASPFGLFRYLHPLLHPDIVFNNHRVRSRMSRFIKFVRGYTGYFNLYSMPYDRLPYMNYCEKRDIFARGGLFPVRNLRDVLLETGIRFHISDWRRTDDENLADAMAALDDNRQFLFVYTAGIDAMLHFHCTDFNYVQDAFNAYAGKVSALLKMAYLNFKTVNCCIFSDHGMTPLTKTIDLKSRIETLPYRYGRDYIACYDSTMLRVYFLKSACRDSILTAAEDFPGHWLTPEEKKLRSVNFLNNRYGDEIWLADPGVQIAPSDMGMHPLPAMHGYSPDDPYSNAVLLANWRPGMIPVTIADYFKMMKFEADRLASSGGASRT